MVGYSGLVSDDLELRWGQYYDAIDLGPEGLDEAEAVLDDLAEVLGEDEPTILFERAVICWEREGPAAAIERLDELLRRDPEHADGHYTRALACEALGDREGMIQHFLETLRLDALIDAEVVDLAAETRAQDYRFIEETAAAVLATVPEELGDHLRNVPIVLEDRPHPQDVRRGFDPRALGMFEGPEHHERDPSVLPTRVVLYARNLLADFPNREQLAEQIEITLLHEIGHYFGLDEDAVERLGLE